MNTLSLLSRSGQRAARSAAIVALVLALPACNTMDRLSGVGDGPTLSSIQDPQAKPGYKPVSMPMPTPQPSQRNPNSLWRNGARAFFKDQRAAQVGDLLTVTVAINDSATVKSNVARNRGTSSSPNSEGLGVPVVPNFLPVKAASAWLGSNGGSATSLFDSSSSLANSGAVARNEAINLRLAAVVTQTLPNGNLVIEGKQQVRVNAEMRELTIGGIVRPEDIDSSNQISYEKIAEARISYGGKGVVSDVQSPRYGQELLDILLPF